MENNINQHQPKDNELHKEKNNFSKGLIVGVAVIALIGSVLIFTKYLQQDLLSLRGNEEVTQTEGSNSSHTRGDKNAKIKIIEYSDIQCPYCSKFHETMKKIVENYPKDVQWTFRHFPIKSHKYAQKAAEASECAGEQDKFWEYLDMLFKNQRKINEAYLPALAQELELDVSQFTKCLSSGKMEAKVNNNFNQGRKANITGTPASIINGKLYKGAMPYESIEEIINNFNN